MKTNRVRLPEGVAEKLAAIRRRETTIAFFRGCALTVTALLGAALAAMLLDLGFGWMNPAARYAATGAVALTGLAAFVAWCALPLARRPGLAATAREVDKAAPQLEERWSTVTELSQSADPPEIRGSDAMIRKVAEEAERAGRQIRPEVVAPVRPLAIAARWLAGAAALMILFFAFNFSHAFVLAQRLLLPGANISLTRVTASPGDTWVPKGEDLTITAALEGRVPGEAKIFVLGGDGRETAAPMTASIEEKGSFSRAFPEVVDSFEYRVRAGDGQTPWRRITAVDRPKISAVRLRVTPPAYTGLQTEEKNALPHAVRVLEGSEVEVAFRSDGAEDRLTLNLGEGVTVPLAPEQTGHGEQGRWHVFRTQPTNSFTLVARAVNTHGLESLNKPACRVTVYEDLAPSARILEPSSDETSVAPGETVKVVFEATDDFGLAKAELLVHVTRADGRVEDLALPVDMGADQGSKHARLSAEIDLAELGLKHGDQLSYVAQVTDTRQLPARAGSAGRDAADRGEAGTSLARNEAGQESRAPASGTESEASGQNADAEVRNPTEGGQREGAALAGAQSGDPRESREAGGDAPPPNEMAMRALDAGQCAACQPRNIKVDEWAGGFDGEKREKLEIAMDPVLKRLDALLGSAHEQAEPLTRSQNEAFADTERARLEGAQKDLGEARGTVSELNSRASGTPYAFMGLQLKNMDQAHMTPAEASLAAVPAASSAGARVQTAEKAVFHIARAREMLADLTKTYETVKRDQKLGDAMQRLAKLHQIFLEDTQALLGSGKSPIHSYERKIAEVDDEFVEKLRELLEEKKKIMAELAKALAEDPRLLRRLLASVQSEGTSLRDQWTLLVEAEKEVLGLVSAWNAASEEDRPGVLATARAGFVARQRELASDAARLRENLETWLPLDVSVEEPRVQAILAKAEEITRLTAAMVSPEEVESGRTASRELRALREALPGLAEISSTNETRMAAYIANRAPEVEALITAVTGQVKAFEALAAGDFPTAMEITQDRITRDTVVLGEKLEMTEAEVGSLSDEIAEKARALNEKVQEEVIPPQQRATDRLAVAEVAQAREALGEAAPAMVQAEEMFGELMRLIVAKLDEAPPPSGLPDSTPGLEELLAMLEDERKAAEGLGIQCRPINVSVMRDWLKPGSQPGAGPGRQAAMQAAQAQARAAQAEAERMARKAGESARQANGDARSRPAVEESARSLRRRGEGWNKLASSLEKDLLQGRDNTPPEQYRDAIRSYFEILAERAAGDAGR